MKKNTGSIIAGFILIILGISILTDISFITFDIKGFHTILGGLFLALYFHKKAYGFLIPGCILLGISLGSITSNWFGYNGINSLSLGISFLAIFIIDYIYKGKTHWWPLIPGTILIILSIRKLSKLFIEDWPILLIVLGVFIIVKSFKINKDSYE